MLFASANDGGVRRVLAMGGSGAAGMLILVTTEDLRGRDRRESKLCGESSGDSPGGKGGGVIDV